MGTQFRVVFYARDEDSASKASSAAFARIAALDQAFSDYKDDSELTLLCLRSGGPAVPVSPDLFEILQTAQALAKETNGAFDVTIGPLVRQWRRARRQKQLPSPANLEEASRRVGYQSLELDAAQRTVRLLRPRMQLDLGGIAKGFACDAARAVLRENGIEAALVDGGGGVSVGSPPPGRTAWRIELKTPGEPGQAPLSLPLSRESVATSGDAEQFLELDGTRYSHIVDPRTGIGLTERIQASVVAPDGAIADALATALCVLGPERGLPIVDKTPGGAALIVRRTLDRWIAHPSAAWRKRFPLPSGNGWSIEPPRGPSTGP